MQDYRLKYEYQKRPQGWGEGASAPSITIFTDKNYSHCQQNNNDKNLNLTL